VRTFYNKTITVEIPNMEIIVQELKQAVQAKTGVAAAQIDLSFGGKMLTPEQEGCRLRRPEEQNRHDGPQIVFVPTCEVQS
jgi:hypothetical protein